MRTDTSKNQQRDDAVTMVTRRALHHRHRGHNPKDVGCERVAAPLVNTEFALSVLLRVGDLHRSLEAVLQLTAMSLASRYPRRRHHEESQPGEDAGHPLVRRQEVETHG